MSDKECKICYLYNNQVGLPHYLIAKLNRKELEDLYYKAREENIVFKKKINFLNKKNTFLNTKLIRKSECNKKDKYIYVKAENVYDNYVHEDSNSANKNEEIWTQIENKINALEKDLEIVKKTKHSSKENKHVKFIDDILEKEIYDIEPIEHQQKIIAKDVYVQTEFYEQPNNLKIVIDTLSEQLAEEQMKVLDLQRQLKKNQITGDIFNTFERRLHDLKSEIKQQVTPPNSNTTCSHEKENTRIMENSLAEFKLNLQTLETTNKELQQEITKLYSKIDDYKINEAKLKEQVAKNTLLQNTQEIKTTNNVVSKIDQITQTDEEIIKPENKNIEKPPLRRQNTYIKETKSNLIPEQIISIDTTENKSQETIADTTINTLLKDNNNESSNEFLKDDTDGTKTEQNETHQLNHITNIDSQDSSDDYLSDGEIKNELIEKVINDTVENTQSTAEKAQIALSVLTKEIDKCKSLMNMKFVKQDDTPINVIVSNSKKTNETMNVEDRVKNFTFRIHIEKIDLLSDLKKQYSSPFYITWQFYKHDSEKYLLEENQLENCNIFSEYNIEFDDNFYEYLITEKFMINVYNKDDDRETSIGNCQLYLKDVLFSLNKKINYISLLSTADEIANNCGKITFWCQLNSNKNQ